MTLINKSKEWSGWYEDGSGNRMGHDEDSDYYPACPLCHGLKPDKIYKGTYLEEHQGHTPSCDFNSLKGES